MATAKKTTTKKTPTTNKAPAKKPVVAKKAPAKKPAVVKKAPVSKEQPVRSFRLSPNSPSFSTFKITRQTVYWVIIVSFIIFMQLWILSLQIETSNYIEEQLSSLDSQE